MTASPRAPVVVAGAGLAGLSCAYHLRTPRWIFERDTRPGGTARSVQAGGFTFDYSGHLLHVRDPYTQQLVRTLLKDNWLERRRKAFIHTHGRMVPYPFQAHLHALPQSIKNECVAGVRRARARWGERPWEARRPLNFKEWCERLFGAGISRHFMVPYNQKLWGVPAQSMTPDWCGGFVPVPTLAEVEAGARAPARREYGYNTRFLYPRRGGIQALAEALARHIPELQTGVSLDAVDWRRRRLRLASGEWRSYARLVSTLPLPELLRRLDPFPDELTDPLHRLRWTGVLCVNLGVARPRMSRASWIYFPEKRFPFYRVGFPMNFTPHAVPRGCSSMYVELSYPSGKFPLDQAGRERVLRSIRAGLLRAKLLRVSDTFAVAHFAPIPYAYVIYDAFRASAVERIMGWLGRKAGIVSIGRYGAWKYSFMEEAILDGRRAARDVEAELNNNF